LSRSVYFQPAARADFSKRSLWKFPVHHQSPLDSGEEEALGIVTGALLSTGLLDSSAHHLGQRVAGRGHIRVDAGSLLGHLGWGESPGLAGWLCDAPEDLDLPVLGVD